MANPKRRRARTRSLADVPHYSVVVAWSSEDGEYVATSPEWPDLSWLASSEAEAIRGLRRVIRESMPRSSGTARPARTLALPPPTGML